MWNSTPIASLCSRVTSGGTPRRDEPINYAPSEIPWIKTGELNDGDIWTSEESISHRGLENSSAKMLPSGTVLMAMYGATVGALGRLAIPATCNQASCAMVVNPQAADSRWLLYSLMKHRSRIMDLANGAAQQNLNAQIIKSFKLPTPPLPEQQAIAEVLGALDDKIAANRALVATADELAEDIFVAATRALPERGLDDLVRPTSGGTPKRDIPEYWTGGTPWVSVRDIHRESAGAILTTEESISPAGAANSAAKQAPRGTVILTARGTVGEVGRLTTPGAFNQSCYGFIPGDVPPAVLFHLIRVAARSSRRVAHGSVFSTITTKTMSALTVPDITKLDCPELETQLAPLHEVIDGACREAASLASLRDTLLPALMDGTIRVKDAITKAEEVL